MADTTVNNNVYDEIHISGVLAGPFQLGDDEAIVLPDLFNDVNVMWSGDGGATWNTLEIEAGTATALAAWFDRDTPGDEGDLIHIAWLEGGVLKYATFDIVAHTASSVTTIATVEAGAANQGSSAVGITKTRNGNLLVVGRVDSSAGTDRNFAYRSTDGGSNWTSRVSPHEDENAETCLLLPANTGDGADAIGIFYDDSALAISAKMYDDSGDSWTETAIASSIDLGAESTVFRHQNIDAKIRHSDGVIIVTCWTTVNNAAADLKVFSANPNSIASPTVATLTNVVTDLAASGRCALAINQQNDDLYVFYGKGNTTWNDTMDVVYKKSTDGGSTWGSETAYSEAAADDNRNIKVGSVFDAGGRIQACWFNDDLNDVFVNLVNDVEIAEDPGSTPVSQSATVAAEHTEAVVQTELAAAEHTGHGVISGTVVLDADSSPVEDAEVIAVRQSSGEVEVIGLTDIAGEFALDPVEPGLFDVYVRRTDSLEALAQTTVAVT